MSLPSDLEISCGNCHHAFKVTVWETVNTRDRQLRDAFLQGNLNVFECPSCGTSGMVPIPVLYHDMDHRLMVCVYESPRVASPEKESDPALLKAMGGLGTEMVYADGFAEARYALSRLDDSDAFDRLKREHPDWSTGKVSAGVFRFHYEQFKKQSSAPAALPDSLTWHIIGSIAASAVKRRILGGQYIRFRRYLGCYLEAFEVGAVLGYCYRDRLVSFAKLFSPPGRETEIISFVRERARRQLEDCPGDPQSFVEISMLAEENRIKKNWRESGSSESQVAFLDRHHKIPIETALENLCLSFYTGVGLGSAFPDLTENFWKTEHEYAVTAEEWLKNYKRGIVDSKVPPEPVTLAQRQEQLRLEVEAFVRKAQPDLMSELGMQAG
jgi:CpXC protein